MSNKKALILVDHGSRFEAANAQLAAIAELIRKRKHGFEIVRHAHMELAHPTIEESFEACVRDGAEDITVYPYFLAPGRHSTTDIPRMVAEAASRFPNVTYRVTEPLGVHENLVDVILERSLGNSG